MNLSTSTALSRFTDFGVLKSLADLAESERVGLYLVGGTVRDMVMEGEIEDLDFAVDGDTFDFARKFAKLASASFVPLDEKRGTARLILHRGELIMDFSTIRGANIVEDLMSRDFTINAMALEFQELMNGREVEIMDPAGGVVDMNNRLIRAAYPESMSNDPIRMLRAYRFAANLDFEIDPATSEMIRDSLSMLWNTSSERIREELFKILAVGDSSCYLREMDNIGLLEVIFPEIAKMKGMEQNEYHHLDVWEHSMLTYELLEREPLPDSMEKYRTEAEQYLDHELVKGRSLRSLMKLAALLHDIGKPASRTVDKNGKTRFFDHNKRGAEIVAETGKRLRLATREVLFLQSIVRDHMYPLGLSVFLRQKRSPKSKRSAMRRFVHRTGPGWLAILMISLADLRATQGPKRREDDQEKLVQVFGEIACIYFDETRLPMPKLVTGKDLMKEFNLPESAAIGRLLRQVREAQINGKVKTRDDAIEMVGNILSKRQL